MKKEINLLDCTFRDGGYYNNWIKNAIMLCDETEAFFIWDQRFNSNGKEYVSPKARDKEDTFLKRILGL